MANLTTYASPKGERIHLLEHQVLELQRAGTWPRDSKGRKFGRIPLSADETGHAPSLSGVEVARMCSDALDARARAATAGEPENDDAEPEFDLAARRQAGPTHALVRGRTPPVIRWSASPPSAR